MFQSTHSLWSATNAIETEETAGFVSIHALLVECDRWNRAARKYCPKFQSTHSLWSATAGGNQLFFVFAVSIHALLVECDSSFSTVTSFPNGFNPRTPCGVRRDSSLVPGRQVQFQSTHSLWSATKLLRIEMRRYLRFQSTHSLWSATNKAVHGLPCHPFQSTHSLWSATQRPCRLDWRKRVSIHALLVECDIRICRN